MSARFDFAVDHHKSQPLLRRHMAQQACSFSARLTSINEMVTHAANKAGTIARPSVSKLKRLAASIESQIALDGICPTFDGIIDRSRRVSHVGNGEEARFTSQRSMGQEGHDGPAANRRQAARVPVAVGTWPGEMLPMPSRRATATSVTRPSTKSVGAVVWSGTRSDRMNTHGGIIPTTSAPRQIASARCDREAARMRPIGARRDRYCRSIGLRPAGGRSPGRVRYPRASRTRRP